MKELIIGLVGSGKTTLYRQLNENQIKNAVEIELPQSCFNDEYLKNLLFSAYYYDENIDVIISHPYFLPQNLSQYELSISYLDLNFDIRKNRIKQRSQNLKTNKDIFPEEFLIAEEKYLETLKNSLSTSRYLGQSKLN